MDELVEMVEAHISYSNDYIDNKMQILSWQTSIIVNCMGTLKRKVKPKDLYKSPSEENSCDGVNLIDEDKKVELENELLSIFELE
ncbi:Uncharacterised protein [[Clostridium] sordellii]|uniref:hypothetical protein n=1 Tax=Paraclostridium sordellii TaxID=1505 RepID=UPI0005DECB1D|nr:hypothetical protein [Paeniclostridium sordellii]CEN30856.1 Uncharacterised protein [[Clostridium] sordellii] [Paeniclostridium sordellii]